MHNIENLHDSIILELPWGGEYIQEVQYTGLPDQLETDVSRAAETEAVETDASRTTTTDSNQDVEDDTQNGDAIRQEAGKKEKTTHVHEGSNKHLGSSLVAQGSEECTGTGTPLALLQMAEQSVQISQATEGTSIMSNEEVIQRFNQWKVTLQENGVLPRFRTVPATRRIQRLEQGKQGQQTQITPERRAVEIFILINNNKKEKNNALTFYTGYKRCHLTYGEGDNMKTERRKGQITTKEKRKHFGHKS
ncbi:hypothetical protein R1sor_024950 [Riccia sorocarpa]|uniref:Uncharacterized protein n=1 Tax=Riccia sorocarpa TaxID=122646 RepID=A0ABD3G772_9MARC